MRLGAEHRGRWFFQGTRSSPRLLAAGESLSAVLPCSCASGSPGHTTSAQPSSDEPQAECTLTIFLISQLFQVMFQVAWCWGSPQPPEEWGVWLCAAGVIHAADGALEAPDLMSPLFQSSSKWHLPGGILQVPRQSCPVCDAVLLVLLLIFALPAWELQAAGSVVPSDRKLRQAEPEEQGHSCPGNGFWQHPREPHRARSAALPRSYVLQKS